VDQLPARPQTKEQEEKDAETRIYQTARGKLPQPEVQLSSFQSWEEIARWYSKLQVDRAKPTLEIRAKAAVLTKGLADDSAKATNADTTRIFISGHSSTNWKRC